MADKLQIFKGALRLLGNNAGLSSLSEVSSAKNALDDAWTPAGEYLFAEGLWNFAMRSVEITASPSLTTGFGHTYVFEKPDDWVRTAWISDRPGSEGPSLFEDYEDKTNYWLASIDTLYVDYVSNDEDYGWNVGAWRQPFAKAMEAYLAFESGLPITSDKSNRNDLFSLFKSRLARARTLDAVDERVKRSPPGRLVRARITSRNQKDG